MQLNILMNASNRYICIHGHFYQPPRENAWLEVIEKQDSAAPFHDWNERINSECYAPNAAARILDEERLIEKIVNNYVRISFNIGPTLLSWMEQRDPATYRRILEADRIARERYNGHGSAIAQTYNHLIMPLANERDQVTQTLWGIKDFEYRFRRKPKGMWLSETAVNTATLEVLAKYGIEFTILAPRQAKAYRKIGAADWIEGGVDPRRPYVCNLPSGRSINLFVYDGNVSQGVAFEGLLNNGKSFAQRLLGALDGREEPQLVHIATDGESYGHHHRYGEMALADCLNHIEQHDSVDIINYEAYLAKFPPQYELQIHDNTSWSCVHGVERWRSDCGCHTGGEAGWHQRWRAPLRDTLDWLRDQLIPIYEREGSKYIGDVWAARDDYIQVLLHQRSPESIQQFFKQHALYPLAQAEQTKVLRMLEMQRHAMLMYTSCAWFFNEISGIETNQTLQYANRAIHYAGQVGQVDLHEEFVQRLAQAPSNIHATGAESYLKNVVPARVDLERVGMHYAAASLFVDDPEELSLFNYTAKNEHFERLIAGTQRFAVGRTVVKSRVTHSEKLFSFVVVYLGQQNILGSISTSMDAETYQQMQAETAEAFKSTDLGRVLATVQRYFKLNNFTIWQLFQDEKRRILKDISDSNLQQAEIAFRDVYNDNYQLMTGLRQSGIPLPDVYTSVIQYVVNHDLEQFFEQEELSIEEIERLKNELEKWNVSISNPKTLTLVAEERIFKEIQAIELAKSDLKHLSSLNTVLENLQAMGVELNVWKGQNLYYSLLHEYKDGKRRYPDVRWEEAFKYLGKLLKVKS